jgi:hypothetical protein
MDFVVFLPVFHGRAPPCWAKPAARQSACVDGEMRRVGHASATWAILLVVGVHIRKRWREWMVS